MRQKKDVLDRYNLGISCFYHDSSIALLDSSWTIIFASLEERFSRKKHDSSFPEKSLQYITQSLKIPLSEIQNIYFYEKPILRFFLNLKAISIFFPFSYLFFYNTLKQFFYNYHQFFSYFHKNGFRWDFFYIDHHLSHAALSYYYSGFSHGAILVLDGVGDNSTSSFYLARDNNIELIKESDFPNSVWLLYSAFTVFCWFEPQEWEYKMMGLASYGVPKYREKIEKIIYLKNNWDIEIDTSYINFTSLSQPFTKKFFNTFGNQRQSGTPIDQYYKDIAASIQNCIESIVVQYIERFYVQFRFSYLCLSGWVFLNCKLNKEIQKNFPEVEIFIPANPGDGGSSLGAVIYGVINNNTWNLKDIEYKDMLYTGYDVDTEDIEISLQKERYTLYNIRDKAYLKKISSLLKDDKLVAVVWLKAEFWPRALGNRSLLASAYNENMKENLNRIKWREDFRPFAPIVLKEDFDSYFSGAPSIDMMYLQDLKTDIFPAITHVDKTARSQVVSQESHTFLWEILCQWKKDSWHGVLLNTSFNLGGEVIVNTIEDALSTFHRTHISLLVIYTPNNIYLVSKK